MLEFSVQADASSSILDFSVSIPHEHSIVPESLYKEMIAFSQENVSISRNKSRSTIEMSAKNNRLPCTKCQ